VITHAVTDVQAEWRPGTAAAWGASHRDPCGPWEGMCGPITWPGGTSRTSSTRRMPSLSVDVVTRCSAIKNDIERTPRMRDRKIKQLASVIVSLNDGQGPDLFGVGHGAAQASRSFFTRMLAASWALSRALSRARHR
jgi:hypothetical protein